MIELVVGISALVGVMIDAYVTLNRCDQQIQAMKQLQRHGGPEVIPAEPAGGGGQEVSGC